MKAIGIRREDKSRWERRAPLTPHHVERLVRETGMKIYVQPSTIRVFPDEAYVKAGAVVQEDLSPCHAIVGIKEIPADQFEEGKTYLFFSHTIKGQPYNMPMLRRMMEKRCQLVDYEKIVDAKGRRLVLFGRHAGLAGMIESLHALGKRLGAEGVKEKENPFFNLRQPYRYANLDEATSELRRIGQGIAAEGLPECASPLIVGFLGYGNVSKGAQEILDNLPVEELKPEQVLSVAPQGLSNRTLYKVVFREEDTVEASDRSAFSLDRYYAAPELYRPVFSRYLACLTILVCGVYWDERYPVLVSAEDVRNLYAGGGRPMLRVIGDITCDIEGTIAITRKPTMPDRPSYVYDAVKDTLDDDLSNLRGPVVMAVEILPTEFPVESSSHFGDALLPFLPALAAEDFQGDFAACGLPQPIREAVILYHGRLTGPYRYLEKHLA